jgi:hypothetical protein
MGEFFMYRFRHIARELAANAAMGIPPIKRRRVRTGRTIGFPADTKAQLVLEQFNFYVAAIGLDNIPGKVIAEIGPGDAVPLALLFLAAGARRYVAVDRFLGDIYGSHALGLYSALEKILPDRLLDGLNHLYQTERCKSVSELLQLQDRVQLYRTPIERASEAPNLNVDYIVSFNVCEHLADLPRALHGMRSMMAPAGLMVHRIDYGPHDIWQSYRNPLAFLTVPHLLWRLTTSNRGCPNRVRHNELMLMIRALGLKSVDRIGRRASIADVSEARPYFASQFRTMDDEDIAVLDAEIVCSYANPPLHASNATLMDG